MLPKKPNLNDLTKLLLFDPWESLNVNKPLKTWATAWCLVLPRCWFHLFEVFYPKLEFSKQTLGHESNYGSVSKDPTSTCFFVVSSTNPPEFRPSKGGFLEGSFHKTLR